MRCTPSLQQVARRIAPYVLRRPLSRTQSISDRHADLPVVGARAVLAGDSSIALFPLLDLFTPLRNRGVNGETVDQVRRRLPALLSAQPERLLLLAGTNDLLRGRGVEATARALVGLLDDAVRLGPETRCVVLSVLPMRSELQRRIPAPEVIAAVNDHVEAAARARGCSFVDLHPPLIDAEGELRRELTTNGVHLTMAAYAAIAPLLAPVLD